MTELLTLHQFEGVDARKIDLAARRFAIEKIPQNLMSYPMAKRETRIMAVDPNFMKEYAARPKQAPMSVEDRQKQMADVFKP